MLAKKTLMIFLSLQIALVSIVQPVFALSMPKGVSGILDFGRTKAIASSQYMLATMADLRLKIKNDPQWKKKATQKVIKGAKTVTLKPIASSVKTIGHSGQTMLVLALLSMFEVAMHKSHQKRITGEEFTMSEKMDIAIDSFDTIINRGEIYFAMAGAGTVTAVSAVGAAAKTLFGKALGLTREAASKSNAFFKFLKGFFAFGLGSLITFIGWEVGVQLWQEATNMLEDPDEIEKAMELRSAGEFARWLSGKSATTENQILFSKIMTNAFIILFDDEELRAAWLYNAWRKRMATGDFVVMLTALAASGFLGMKVGAVAGGAVGGVPGAIITGFFGLIFTLVGAGLGLMAPPWIKEPITDFIVSRRIGIGRSRLHVNEQNLRNLMRGFYLSSYLDEDVKQTLIEADQFKAGRRVVNLKGLLKKRSDFRNDILTAYFEKYYRAKDKILAITRDVALANVILKLDLSQIDFSQVEMNVKETDATQSPKQDQIVTAQEVVDEGLKRIDYLQVEIDHVEQELLKFYDGEARELAKFIEMREHHIPEDVATMFLTELLFMKLFNVHIISTVVGFKPERIYDVDVSFIENTLGYFINDYPVMIREDYDFDNLNALQECELNITAKVNLNAFYDHSFNEGKLLKLITETEDDKQPQSGQVSNNTAESFLKQCISWQEFRKSSEG